MTKRFLAFSLVFVLVAMLFSACGSATQTSSSTASVSTTAASSEAATQATTAAQADPKELYVFTTQSKDVMTVWTEDFVKQTGITIKEMQYPQEKYIQALMVYINGGSQLDILDLMGQHVRSFANKGILMDLTSICADQTSRFLKPALDYFTFQNKLYCLPTSGGCTSMCYYNVDMFKEYNLKVPETYADMVADNNILKKHGKTLFGFGGGNTYMWPMWFFDVYAQTSGNKSVERTTDHLTGKAKFTDPDVVEALQILANFAKEGMFQPGVNGTDTNGGKAVFTSGKAAMFFGGDWDLTPLRNGGFDEKSKHLGVIPFPVVKEGAKSEQTGSAATMGLAIYSKINPANLPAALKYIENLTSDEVISKVFYGGRAEMPTTNPNTITCNANVHAPANLTPDVNFPIIKDVLTPSTVLFLDNIWPPEITNEFKSGIQAVVGLQISPEAEAAKIQKVMDDLLAKGFDFNKTN